MKLCELFLTDDVKVYSSWIDSLDYDGRNAIMNLRDGRSYLVTEVPEQLFNQWLKAPSKGRFWHDKIKAVHKTYKR